MFGMVNQHIGNHALGIFWCGRIWPWAPLQGQMRIAKLKSAYNSLVIGTRGFGALSLWWIQFASVLRCARSSYSSDARRGYYLE